MIYIISRLFVILLLTMYFLFNVIITYGSRIYSCDRHNTLRDKLFLYSLMTRYIAIYFLYPWVLFSSNSKDNKKFNYPKAQSIYKF